MLGFIVPTRPQPLLAPDQSQAWKKLRVAFEKAQKDIVDYKPDLILIYSTHWLSVIGHQIQADPNPRWNLVDQEFHELGTIEYDFKIDREFALEYNAQAQKRGLHSRTISYEGFPMDAATVQALKLLNPQNIPACVVSCNMYADRAETIVLGKAARDAINKLNKKVVVVSATALSNRIFTKDIDPQKDHIYSDKDDEWNRKLLEFVSEGRLEDVSQLAREFSKQAHGDQKMKAIWWLAAVMGQNNQYKGKVYEYQPLWGSGAAVASFKTTKKQNMSHQFDEGEIEYFKSNDSVIGAQDIKTVSTATNDSIVNVKNAPRPVGAYPHAKKVGDMIYLSGIGPRNPQNNSVPGGPVYDDNFKALKYDIEKQTEAVIANVKEILKESQLTLEHIVDVQVFLINMKKDFTGFNKTYNKYFNSVQATRTTVEVQALPTPIAVEFKIIAQSNK